MTATTDNTGPQLASLLNRKFGKHRGRNTRAVQKLGIHFSNLSSALNGTTKLPLKYLEVLRAMPDYAPPSGIAQELYEDGAVNQLITWFTVRLTPTAASNLELIARTHCRPRYDMPDLSANEDATARLFEIMLASHLRILETESPEDLQGAKSAIQRDKEEARKQLRFELNERKHLVADELTENEITASSDDEVDPLA